MTSAPAQIVGRDPSSDLAVLRAQGVSGLTPVTLGNSDSLRVGQQVARDPAAQRPGLREQVGLQQIVRGELDAYGAGLIDKPQTKKAEDRFVQDRRRDAETYWPILISSTSNTSMPS